MTQARSDGALNPESVGGRSGWISAAYILKAELIRFTDRFYVNITEKGVK